MRPRRFYAKAEAAAATGGFAVLLDDRPARTPQNRPLLLPTLALAQLLAAEWAAQGEKIVYDDMPATRLAHTALDGVAVDRGAVVDGFARFAESDLLCYFADHPVSLVGRQETLWIPLLDWARDGPELRFVRTTGIAHVAQPLETLRGVVAIGAAADNFSLAGLAFGAALFGSAILALALRAGRLNAHEAMATARLDEIFQEARWGVDAESANRADLMATDAAMLERWFLALR